MKNELYHIRGFKYITKIPIGRSYRYFYSMDDLRAFYDKGKRKINNAVNQRSSIARPSRTRSFYQYHSKKKISTINGDKLNKAKEWFEKKLKKEKTEIKPDYKYIKKISVDGKARYFYSDDEYQAYLKRKDYYANDPDFMKKFNKSKDPYTAQEDAVLVNPKFKSLNSDYQNNCAECSVIYELRRRGYDVESNGVSGLPNAWAWWKRQIIEPNQAIQYNSDLRYKQYYKNPKIQNVKVDSFASDEDYAKAIEKTIKKNPPGSRGEIAVNWVGGGGHSMVWEIDKKGNTHIYDTQASGTGSRIEYKTTDLSKYVAHSVTYSSTGQKSYTEIVRTDNLELNKGVTKICKNASSKKKGVSKKKITNPSLSNYAETNWNDKELQTQYPVLYQEERRK